MNITEKYIYEVYRTKSFTVAAKNMFVSQPALSATIIKHEAKLGFNIFDRKVYPITLTKEGEIYICYLEESMRLKMKFDDTIKSLHTDSIKKISIGGSNSAAFIAIPKICREFNKKFPDVSIDIDVGTSGYLFEKLDRGMLDVIITSNQDSPKYNYITLWKEKYLLIVRKDYPGVEKLKDYCLSYDEVISGEVPGEKEVENWNLFKQITVIKPSIRGKGLKKFFGFFDATSSEKYKVYSFRNLDMHYALMTEGLGATIMPQSSIIETGYNPRKFCCFAIKAEENNREVMLAYKSAPSLTPYAEELIKIAREMF